MKRIPKHIICSILAELRVRQTQPSHARVHIAARCIWYLKTLKNKTEINSYHIKDQILIECVALHNPNNMVYHMWRGSQLDLTRLCKCLQMSSVHAGDACLDRLIDLGLLSWSAEPTDLLALNTLCSLISPFGMECIPAAPDHGKWFFLHQVDGASVTRKWRNFEIKKLTLVGLYMKQYNVSQWVVGLRLTSKAPRTRRECIAGPLLKMAARSCLRSRCCQVQWNKVLHCNAFLQIHFPVSPWSLL